MECAFMLKKMGCAQGRKMQKVNIHKLRRITKYRIYRIRFWISEMLQKFVIVWHVGNCVASPRK